MIKIKTMEQALALARTLDTEAGADGGVQIAQANDGTVGVSRMNITQKIERHIYVKVDGETEEVDCASA